MRPSDVEKTGFCTPYGNFHFKVMPMGLCGAPSTFQYLMDDVFRDALSVDGTSVPVLHFLSIFNIPCTFYIHAYKGS